MVSAKAGTGLRAIFLLLADIQERSLGGRARPSPNHADGGLVLGALTARRDTRRRR